MESIVGFMAGLRFFRPVQRMGSYRCENKYSNSSVRSAVNLLYSIWSSFGCKYQTSFSPNYELEVSHIL